MLLVNNFIKYLYTIYDAFVHHFFQWIPDKINIKLRYRIYTGKRLNLDNPKTFQEKIQWLKLNDRNPRYTELADKILVKDYVTHIIGSKHVVPLLGVWEKPEDIEWEKLPNRFVLKTNHGGGNTGVVICRDKKNFNKEEAIKLLNASLKSDIYSLFREWQYKNIKKRVFAEELIEINTNVKDIPDYKWFCFNGEPKYCQVLQNRTTKETIDFFDTEWNHQDFIGLNPFAEHASSPPSRPLLLDTQIKIAKALSCGLPFARIDLYQVNNKVYFGEITLYPASGLGEFRPKEWDYKFGELLQLPEK